MGQALVDEWLRSGQTLRTFLHQRGVAYSTWSRVVYGHTQPTARTVIRLADAVGLDRNKALRLAGLRPAPGTVAPPPAHDESWTHTALGDALEACRLASGESVHAFCASRGLDFSTWYQIVRHGHTPRRSTVIKYATAAGLDVNHALTLSGYPPQPAQPQLPL